MSKHLKKILVEQYLVRVIEDDFEDYERSMKPIHKKIQKFLEDGWIIQSFVPLDIIGGVRKAYYSTCGTYYLTKEIEKKRRVIID